MTNHSDSLRKLEIELAFSHLELAFAQITIAPDRAEENLRIAIKELKTLLGVPQNER